MRVRVRAIFSGEICFGFRAKLTLALALTLIATTTPGICQATKPIYVTELAPASYRGRVMAVFSLAYSAGIMATKLVHYAVRQDIAPPVRWRLVVALGTAPALALLLVIVTCVPESPVWLSIQNGTEEERKGLTRRTPS